MRLFYIKKDGFPSFLILRLKMVIVMFYCLIYMQNAVFNENNLLNSVDLSVNPVINSPSTSAGNQA